MIDPWRVLAAVLVVILSVLFAALFAHRRRRVRYLLRNRLTPLRVPSEELTPIDGWLPWAIAAVVVVVALAIAALA